MRYRHFTFADRHMMRLEEVMRGVRTDFETDLAGFNGKANHVYLLVNFPPKAAVSKLASSLKGVSSRRMRQEFLDLRRRR